MKAKKLIALFAFAALGLCADSAFAQSTGNDDPPPPMSSYDESGTTEAESYNDKVTIEGEGSTSTEAQVDAGFAAQPEKKERLRVYSGKHDGNNVIYDPR